jgi:hypothetical protein
MYANIKAIAILLIGSLQMNAKFMKLGLIFTILGSSLTSYACMPVYLSLEDRVKQSKHIYVGYVTGVINQSMEQQLQEANSLENIAKPERFSLRIKVTETLKAKSNKSSKTPNVIEQAIKGCGSTLEIGTKVLVFDHHFFNQPNVLLADAEQQVRALLKGQ